MNRQSTAWGIPIYLSDEMPANKALIVTNHERSSMTDSRKENQREVLDVLMAHHRDWKKGTGGPMVISPNLSRSEIHGKVFENIRRYDDLSLGDVHLAIEDLHRHGLIDRHQVRGVDVPPKFSIKEEFVKYQDLLATLGGLGRRDSAQ